MHEYSITQEEHPGGTGACVSNRACSVFKAWCYCSRLQSGLQVAEIDSLRHKRRLFVVPLLLRCSREVEGLDCSTSREQKRGQESRK